MCLVCSLLCYVNSYLIEPCQQPQAEIILIFPRKNWRFRDVSNSSSNPGLLDSKSHTLAFRVFLGLGENLAKRSATNFEVSGPLPAK